MKKYNTLKKKLIKEGVIAAGVLAFLAGVMLLVGSLVTSLERDNRTADANKRSIVKKINKLEDKHQIVTSSISEFQELRERETEGQFRIDRNEIQRILDDMRKRYRISNLSLSVGPIAPVRGETFDKETLITKNTRLEISFGALSDVHAFSFMNDVLNNTPGFMKIVSFNIERERKISNDVYISVSRGEEPRMVSVNASIEWLGYERVLEEEEEASNNAP